MEEGKQKLESLPLLEILHGGAGGGATASQTVGHIVVSILGTGALGLPYAFRVSGWLAASLGLVLACFATYYCMLLLVKCRNKLEQEQEDQEPVHIKTYGDLGFNAFGPAGRLLTELLILISYTGGAVAYLLFIGENLSSLATHIPSSAFIFFLLLPIEAGLSCIRSLAVLAPFSVLADACNVLAMAIVLKEDARRVLDGGVAAGARDAFNGAWSLPFAGGVAVFCFEGLGMTLALEGSMAQRRRFPWVLLQALIGIVVAYVCFGVFGYLAFGDETQEIITLNLPDNWSAAIVKVGLSIALAFTFPMTMHPVHEIIETRLKSSGWFQRACHISPSVDWLGLRVLRLLVVILVSVMATSVPGFGALVSFTGSTVCACLSFVLPAAFHLKLMGPELSLWETVLDYTMVSLGLVFAGYGTYAAASGHSMG